MRGSGAGGTTRFVVGAFTPFTNTFRNVPYSPLELYLMGLAPAAEVPASFHVLTNATIVEPHTDVNGTAIVEADGMEIIPFAAILERHGEVPLLAASERAFRSAFVVISASPASDEVMNDVAAYAAAFGNRAETAEWLSFETHTQGRATMTTTLGARPWNFAARRATSWAACAFPSEATRTNRTSFFAHSHVEPLPLGSAGRETI